MIVIPQDKANHFIYGFMIYFLSNLFLNEYYSFGIVLIVAVGKEIYDKTFDYKDLIATIIPALLLILKIIHKNI